MRHKKPFIISFEFFPPKTAHGTQLLQQTAETLKSLSPHFFSVTFGAGGSTRDGTLETVAMLQKTNISVAPHLACVGLKREELKLIIEKYQALDIKRIVALRGDLPSGMGQNGELRYANELVSLIREISGSSFYIEVAAYPEVHPQAKTAEADLLYLKKKMEAGANSAITQYFFNPDAYFYFVDECVKHGITIPIVPGIMPINNFEKLVRFSEMCGAEIPRWIRKRLESYSNDNDILEFGREVVYQLCDRLIEKGAPGLHFYTLNHADSSVELVKMLNVR